MDTGIDMRREEGGVLGKAWFKRLEGKRVGKKDLSLVLIVCHIRTRFRKLKKTSLMVSMNLAEFSCQKDWEGKIDMYHHYVAAVRNIVGFGGRLVVMPETYTLPHSCYMTASISLFQCFLQLYVRR